ncbi:putative succinate semialdehyde dehydrogenase [Hyaloscypha variabilis]
MAVYSTPAQVEADYTTLFKTFSTGKTKNIAWRKLQLKRLWYLINDNQDDIISALRADLNRPVFETFASEIRSVKDHILEYLDRIDEWAADEIPNAGFLFTRLAGARIRKEPLGVTLIIGPWNYPISLILQPLIAAIAAGCCALIKPSEVAPASEQFLAAQIPRYLDTDAVRVVTGGIEETTRLLEKRYDHIFFTGSTKVGKVVQAAAAKHLTPTVLELGGQGPSIVTDTADVDMAAKRCAYAKFVNAGQICLSVNHAFVDPKVYDEFLERTAYWFEAFLGKGSGEGDGNGEFCRIVNERNWERLTELLGKTKGRIVYGGKNNRERKYIQPTIISGLTSTDSLMSEELFGPYLPVIKASYQEACRIISTGEHPLAIYLFTKSTSQISYVLNNTTSGGLTVNDVFLHASIRNTPFGGVGHSGTGYYHGKYGFLAFSQLRAVVHPPSWLERVVSFRYPPYTANAIRKLELRKVPFSREERIEDQSVGKMSRGLQVLRWWLGRLGRIATIALLLALLDKRMGGQPWILQVLVDFVAKSRQTLGQ